MKTEGQEGCDGPVKRVSNRGCSRRVDVPWKREGDEEGQEGCDGPL